MDGLHRRRPRPRPAGDHGHRPQPHVRRARLVPGRRWRPARAAGSGPATSSATGRGPDGGATAERLGQRVRRSGVDAGHRGRRDAGPVVPAPVRHQAARSRLARRRGPRRVRVDPALLVRPWRRRLPHRRRPRAGEGSRRCPTSPAGFAAGGPAAAGHPHWDLDEVHDVYRRWREVSDALRRRAGLRRRGLGADRRAAGPLPARPTSCTRRSTSTSSSPRGTPPRCARRSTRASTPSTRSGAPPTWVLSNHDVVRHVTRYGGGELGTRRARAAALLMLALPGGAYVYQGEELGLPEVTDLPDEVRQDPTFLRTGRHGHRPRRVPGADARGPATAPPFGFGPGSGQPWLPQPAEWADADRRAPGGRPGVDADAVPRRPRPSAASSPALGDGR